ncbi:MAG: NTP transferase domain-containing protein [Polyangiaceae bacterium]|nr:NTP transferase domain-containing protein [Polyangiaceae bacterium]
MGGPKALLAWLDGAAGSGAVPVPLAVAHARARLGVDCERVLVVASPEVVARLAGWLAAQAGELHAGLELVPATSPDPAGSIAAALAHGRLGPLVLLTPVDCPPAGPRSVAALRSALALAPAKLAARPRHAGRGGHPVLVRRAALAPYASPAPPPLRELLRSLGPALAEVEVDDPSVLADLDTPASLAAYGCGVPRFFGGGGLDDEVAAPARDEREQEGRR